MKLLSKIAIVLMCVLFAVSAVSLLNRSASAAGGLPCQAAVSANSSTVSQDTSFTFSIKNTGTNVIGSANITVPLGYTNIRNLAVGQQPPPQNWAITLETGKTNYYILLYGSTQGLSSGETITFTFNAKNPPIEGNYKWIVGINGNTNATATDIPQSTSVSVSSSPIVISAISDAVLILIIAAGIAFLNTALNRFLINYFVGWEQYRVMQKEMNEYRQETMAAARANDKKQMEKLKKRQSQITNMQAKMLKPQMVQLGISFVYIFIWIFVLTPTYGTTSMVYLPGFGPLAVVYWYPICSFFLGILASRLLGIMPIEP